MKISVFGLGYVGTISAACLAQMGHEVIGVDVNPNKIGMIAQGQSPVMEAEIGEIIAEQMKQQRLTATADGAWAFARTDLSLICVGTPGKENGSIDLTYVQRIFEEIGDYLSSKSSFHWIVLRSTVLPGTTEQSLIPILEKKSGNRPERILGSALIRNFCAKGVRFGISLIPPRPSSGF